jgi:predicted amidohydrolase YtcJ
MMRIMRGVACAAAVMTAASAIGAASDTRPAAALIVSDAKIWTGDAKLPEAQALAVLDGRIVAIGSDSEVMAWRGPATQVVKANGGRIVPGFNDAHVHILDGGMTLESVQLHEATSAEDFARRIGEQAARTPKGEWIEGGNWDETRWKVVALPTRQLIDGAAPDVPVAVSRYDGHAIVVNSLALKLAGISATTADPPGGFIVRDAQGEPTGVLKDAAADLVFKVIPPLSHAQRRAYIEHALRHAASLGVTSMQDMSNADVAVDYANIAVYAELREQGLLTARIYAAPALAGVDDWTRIGLRRAFGDSSFRVGAFKSFADGSAGSRTAYFFEPYTDNPKWRGLISKGMQPLSLARTRMLAADAAGFQLCTHAIGDAAISTVLDLYADVAAANGPRDRRWRIEHSQHMAAKDFDRYAQLGVIASVQPFHAIDDGRWIEERIGHDRASRTYAFRTMLEHGIHLAFGTDWSVAPLDPMQTLYAATTRATLDGKNPGGWFPEQKLTIAEALTAYTQGSAYAEFQENEKGTLRPGALADFVLLSADILAIGAERLRDVKVRKTWVGGRVVYEAAH